MRQFHLAYSGSIFWLQPAAKLPKRSATCQFWLQPAAKLAAGDRKQFVRQLVAEIPWGHHLVVLNQLPDPGARLYYLSATAQFGWSRNVLLNQIKAGAYERAVREKKTHNFPLALPEHLAEQFADVEVEFALKTKNNPIGVAEYQLQAHLPAQFKGRLPTAKQLANAVRQAREQG